MLVCSVSPACSVVPVFSADSVAIVPPGIAEVAPCWAAGAGACAGFCAAVAAEGTAEGAAEDAAEVAAGALVGAAAGAVA